MRTLSLKPMYGIIQNFRFSYIFDRNWSWLIFGKHCLTGVADMLHFHGFCNSSISWTCITNYYVTSDSIGPSWEFMLILFLCRYLNSWSCCDAFLLFSQSSYVFASSYVCVIKLKLVMFNVICLTVGECLLRISGFPQYLYIKL